MKSLLLSACLAVLLLAAPASSQGQTPGSLKGLLDSPAVSSVFDTLMAPDYRAVSAAVANFRTLGANPRIADRNALLGIANIIEDIFGTENKVVLLPRAEIERVNKFVIQMERAAEEWKRPNALTKKPDMVNASNALRKADGGRKQVEAINANIRQMQPVLIQALRRADTAAVHYRQADCIGTAIGLTSCIHVINDRSVSPGSYAPTFSKRWMELKRMTPSELASTQLAASAQLVAFLVGRFKLEHAESADPARNFVRAVGEMWMSKKLDDALFTIFIDLQDIHQQRVKEFLISVAEEGLSDRTIAASGSKDKFTQWLLKIDPDLVNVPAVTGSVYGILGDAVRQGTPGR